MKLFVLKKLLKSLGEGVTLKSRIHFETPHLVSIESNVYINQDVYFGNGFTTIKNHTMIGPDVKFLPSNHSYDSYKIPMHEQPDTYGEIIVHEDVWIGAGSIILKDVQLARGTVVGAGSVVTKNTTPFSIIAGNPAKKIKNRFSDQEIKLASRIHFKDQKKKIM